MAPKHICLLAALLAFAFAASPTSAATVTLTGQVLGPDNQPVPGAQVLANYGSAQGGSVHSQTTSVAGGSFSLSLDVKDPQQPVTVAAVKDGLAVACVSVVPGDRVLIELGADPVACAGRVTGPEGDPIPGAEVWVRMVYGLGANRLWLGGVSPLRDTTDAAGKFEIGRLHADAAINIQATAEGRAFAILFERMPADTKDIAVVLGPGGTISGRITRDGKPVAGIRILCELRHKRSASGAHGNAVSAQDGTYDLSHLRPGAYFVIFLPPPGLTARSLERVQLGPGDHFNSGDTELITGGLVEGAVTDADTGRPISGVYVSAYGPSRPRVSDRPVTTRTDESGRYSLRLAPGTNRVSVSGHHSGLRSVTVVQGQTVTAVDLALPTRPAARTTPGPVPLPALAEHTIRGRVVLPDGKPAVGVRVAALPHRAPSYGDLFKARTDDRGCFEVASSARGVVILAVLASDPARKLAGALLVPSSEPPEDAVEIELDEGSYLVVSTVDTEDNPLPNVDMSLTMYLRRPHGNGLVWSSIGAQSDGDGRVTIGPLPPGLPLEFRPDGDFAHLVVDEGAWAEPEITLAPGEVYELPPLRLNPQGRTLKGRVVDENEQPIAGARVTEFRLNQSVRTDERGAFTLTGLPLHGPVWILACSLATGRYVAEQIDFDTVDDLWLTLYPLGAVCGRVCDAEGQPVRDAWVDVSPIVRYVTRTSGMTMFWASSHEGLPPFLYTTSDGEGKWTIGDVVAGAPYQATARRRGSSGDDADRVELDFLGPAGDTLDLGDMILSD